ncbi:MAG: OmpA/MotB family protein [Candidatus Hydrothermia bacterium]|jgi:flagellar motor protein MotB
MKFLRDNFSFWPPFVDFMLFLVLLVVFTFSVAYSLIIFKYIDITKAISCQEKMKNLLIKSQKFVKIDSLENAYTIYYNDNYGNYYISLINELQLQRIRVSTGLLFDKNDYKISERGYDILRVLGGAIKSNLECIERIQIEGHADTDPTTKFRSNLELAGLRAFEIFYFLKDSIGISPSRYLMSAASFGEYKPLNRHEDSYFDEDSLIISNNSEEKKSLNRRVEFLIFYKKR